MSLPGHPHAGYLPRLLLARVVATPRLEAPEAQSGPGVLLLSDIERFSTLVESFTAAGPDGLEELTWLLNGYFADLVDTVHGHGGDVLYIAGDAFVCHWPVGQETLPEVVARAAQAGLAMQHRLHDRPARPGLTIRTRIGIGAGELVTAFVGGVGGRWELIATGPALGAAIAAERHAMAGRVAVAPATWDLVRTVARGTRGPDGFVTVDTVAPAGAPRAIAPVPNGLDDAVLRPFLPPAVVDRLMLPDAQWLAESRRVTVLLADLPPLADASAAALARTHAGVRAFQEVVERYEGTIKVDVDDKGILLLSIFGLPPRAHEDDAERAAVAARQLADALVALGVPCGVGVATGRAICGAFGGDARRDYMVRGDAINLAARLMQAAGPGEILCDAATVEGTRGRMAFEERAPITVKGRAEPVRVYHPAGRRERTAGGDVAMVGRAAERATIAACLDRLREVGGSALVVIEGDAGLGKSRLLSEATTLAAAAGVRVLRAAADAIEQATPFYAWRPVFTALFDIAAGTDVAAARARVVDRLRPLPELERMAPLVSGVLPITLPDNELTAAMPGDVRAANTRRLLLSVLRAAAESGPLVIALEDAHWLDSSSWGLLLEATQAVSPLLALVTTRPMADPAPAEYGRLMAAAGDLRLRLAGLSREETVALVARRLDVDDVPESLAAFIHERVSGHPFFAEELLQAMVERGAVRVADGRCAVGDLTALDLPTTVEKVIVSRLDRLVPAEQLCLKVASVIGRVFRSRLVQQTYPVPDERARVPGHLGALTTADLIGLETPEPDLAYLFKHVITRDVTYDTMPQAQRRPLHRAVAEWYEANHEDLAPFYALLAYHWGQAADAPKTGAYLEKAGQQAVRDGAFREGVIFLTQALALMDGGAIPEAPVRRALWEKGIGTASYFLGDMPASRTHLERALRGLHKPVPSSASGALRGALAAVVRQAAHRAAPRRFLNRRAAEKALLDEAVECYKSLGQAYYMKGEAPPRLIYATINGLNVGEEAGDSAPLARVLINAAMLAYIVGLPTLAERYAQRALAMAEAEGHYSASAFVWAIRALLLAQQARWREFKDATGKALELVREIGDIGLESEIWLVRSTVAHCAGDFVYAPTAWTQMREVATRNGNIPLKCWSLLDEVDTRLARGETDDAERALAEALAIPTPPSDALLTLEKARGVAVTRQRQGRLDEALAAADTIFDLTKKTPPTGYHAADHFAAAIEVYVAALGEGAALDATRAGAVRRRATKGVAMLAKYARTFVNVRARASLLRGMLAARRGRPDEARRSFERAAATASALETPFEHGRALLELARLDPARRTALHEEARRLFALAGAPYFEALAS